MQTRLFFICSILWLAVPFIIKAQTNPGPLCGIWFDYDAAGNRIKRYNDCKEFDPNSNPYSNHPNTFRVANTSSKTAEPIVSPNPTSGLYTISLPPTSKISSVHFHWYDAKGSLMSSGNFLEESFTGNIASFAPGNYLLMLRWQGISYSYKVTKI